MYSTLRLIVALVVIAIADGSALAAEVAWPAESINAAVNLTPVEGPGSNDFYLDLSGAFWNPVTRRLWVCRNGPGGDASKFWAMRENGAGSFEIDVKNGNRGEWTGFGDLEDLTQADLNENVIYLMVETEERIKEYDVSTYGTAVLRNDWNTYPFLPLNGGSGAEGICFVPDSALTAGNFVDPSGNPRVSQNGMGGLMFVAHQNGGRIYVFDLNRTNGTFTYVGAYLTGFWESCALAFDRSTNLLYIFHGANYNRIEVTTLASTNVGGERKLNEVVTYAPPTGSSGSENMEGIALFSNDDSSGGYRSLFMTIDGGGANSLYWFKNFPVVCSVDSDADGVNDCIDVCQGTPAGQQVNASGCSCQQSGQGAPTITAQPGAGAVCSGQTWQFCVSATGNGTLSYQWKKDGSNISGATSSCYTASAAGSYQCVVTDGCGSTTSDAATLTLNAAPSFSAHPAAGTICSGQTYQFCVTASGTGALTYQWQKDGSNVAGATASCYTASASGSYQCVVTNGCGSATCNSATLTVNAAPSISTQPVAATICSGQTNQFCVTATGSGALTYQWQKDSVNISGATAACYTASAAGSYRCIVTNSCGSSTSNSAALTLNTGPSISAQPSAGSICSGQTYQFCITASGSGTLTYQWQKDSVNISGATSTCYTANGSGSYRCIVTNSCGSATSNAASLTVSANMTWYRDADGDGFGDPAVTTSNCQQPAGYVSNNLDCNDANAGVNPNAADVCGQDRNCDGAFPSAPSFSAHPVAGSVCSGQTLQFCVTATGTAPLTYQWQKDGSNVAGATSACYTASQAGSYRCVVSNSCGTATSNAAALTLNNAPSITAQPVAGTVCSGQTLQFCVTASGSGTLSYQWQKDGSNVSGATSNCYTASQSGNYRCVVSNACGSATSNTAALTVNSAPAISVQPTGGSICSGQNYQFCVTASGSGTLTFQWQKDGANISGATATCYTAAQSGSYRCLVSNNCGTTTSNAASLATVANMTWYRDQDGDGFGNPAVTQQNCQQPAGYVSNNLDCNDADAGIHPGATDVCGQDRNCDAAFPSAPSVTAQPSGAAICSGQTLQLCVSATGTAPLSYQWQRDGSNVAGATGSCFGATLAGSYRCVVSNSCGAANSDTAVVSVADSLVWYRDSDQDGFGDPQVTQQGCQQPAGFVASPGDCNDADPNVHPGMTDVCGQDRNCDGVAPQTSRWYRDADGDGFGNPSQFVDACDQPAGYVSDASDCDDQNSATHPGAPELCDGRDNNCDGAADEPANLPDSDGDGVNDCADTCPETPAGTAVDSSGCPIPAQPGEQNGDQAGDVAGTSTVAVGGCGASAPVAIVSTLLGLVSSRAQRKRRIARPPNR